MIRYIYVISFTILLLLLPGSTFVFSDFVPGRIESAENYRAETINEGAFLVADQELIYEGPYPRQSCPGMVGPFSDGSYYCSAKEYGYCDRRSGTCFCNIGYEGIDCSQCQGTHYRLGNLCYPKVLCPNDCNGAGTCNHNNGTCDCLPHRMGSSCEIIRCTIYDDKCISCSTAECLLCQPGYYLTKSSNIVCSSCSDFDPRCVDCTSEEGCTVCADSILTSVHRSGYRSLDPKLPIEESEREFSITLPFGTKSPDSFADAETFFVVPQNGAPLNHLTKSCKQGIYLNDSWICENVPSSYIFCGHYGVFSFTYPNYKVSETFGFLPLTVRRSGGGFGEVSISYNIYHISTTDSDVSSTAPYTTSQKLTFLPGVIEMTFYVNILDDFLVESDEVFQVVLENPEGGGTIGAQFRTNVTIVDDDGYALSISSSYFSKRDIRSRASHKFDFLIYSVMNYESLPYVSGGLKFYAVIDNSVSLVNRINQQRSIKIICETNDLQNGKYHVICPNGISTQGIHELNVFYIFPGGILGQYYYDAFFQKLALSRIDRSINFQWGTGRLIPRGSDFISIRWSGLLFVDYSQVFYFKFDADDHARLWIDGKLILDHFQERAAYLESDRQIYLTGNTFYEIIVEYREVTGIAFATLLWGNSLLNMSVIPTSKLFSMYKLSQSPVVINIQSDYTNASTTECFGDGLFSGEVMKMSKFSCCPKDSYRNFRNDDDYIFLSQQDFSSSLRYLSEIYQSIQYKGKGSESPPVLLAFNNETFCFDGSYIPNLAGSYQLDIVYGAWRLDMEQHLFGSPFSVNIIPSSTFGPYSSIENLSPLLSIDAGNCFNFTIVAKDKQSNLRLVGGDNFLAYIFQVEAFHDVVGDVNASPSSQPSAIPGLSPIPSSMYTPIDLIQQVQYRTIETSYFSNISNLVTFGDIKDLNNGSYDVQLCPTIAGIYELFVLLNANGISNQQFSILNPVKSSQFPLGKESYSGQYVDKSPYTVIVNHGLASGSKSTASGDGLNHAVVGIPISFFVTIRDIFGNVMRTYDPIYKYKLQAILIQSPESFIQIADYGNGSCLVTYIAEVSGVNYLNVTVNGENILGSPFNVSVLDGEVGSRFSYATGKGLSSAIAGSWAYFEVHAFDIDGNRKSTSSDIFHFSMTGSNILSGTLTPCFVTDSHCSPYDSYLGHYLGAYVPVKAGRSILSISVEEAGSLQELQGSPFVVIVFPSDANANKSVVRGDIYDIAAGQFGKILIEINDRFSNHLQSGGDELEVSILSPEGSHYAKIVDMLDGTYLSIYNLFTTGQYQVTAFLSQYGLLAYVYNTSGIYLQAGYLLHGNLQNGIVSYSYDHPMTYPSTFSVPTNLKVPGVSEFFQGGLYDGAHAVQIIPSARVSDLYNSNHPQEYWSVKIFGLIIPKFPETYLFYITAGSRCSIRVSIGELSEGDSLREFNPSLPLMTIIDVSDSSNQPIGNYSFANNTPYNIKIEFHEADGLLDEMVLSWSSPSTAFEVIPQSSFKHWANIESYSLTVHPSSLSPIHSTSAIVGNLNCLEKGVVGIKSFFLVVARDQYGNTLDSIDASITPSVLAIGPFGTDIRGDVTFIGNATFSVSFTPIKVGEYELFVSIGCCPLSQSVGLFEEVASMKPLLIQDAPYSLSISPGQLVPSRCFASGPSLEQFIAGEIQTLIISFMDIYDNPTNIEDTSLLLIDISFISLDRNITYSPSTLDIVVERSHAVIVYNFLIAGEFSMNINISYHQVSQSINDSPFKTVISPNTASASQTICRGQGIAMAIENKTSIFAVELFDQFSNQVTISNQSIIYSRVFGDVNVITPTCVPNFLLNRWECSYVGGKSGPHSLSVYQFSGNIDMLGLNYEHFSFSDSLANIQSEAISLESGVVNFIEIEWPQVKSIGAIRWTGFLSPPQSGNFIIMMMSSCDSISSTIYLDNNLIFDSLTKQSNEIVLDSRVIYEIKIVAVRNSRLATVKDEHLHLSLQWKTPLSKEFSIISHDYLLHNPKAVHKSPFLLDFISIV